MAFAAEPVDSVQLGMHFARRYPSPDKVYLASAYPQFLNAPFFSPSGTKSTAPPIEKVALLER
jgi:hypothetical protein